MQLKPASRGESREGASTSRMVALKGSSSTDEEETAPLSDFFCRGITVPVVFSPIAVVLWWIEAKPIWQFIANFCAIVPYAWLIGQATEHLEPSVGPTIGALLNASFGNAVEILLTVSAVRAKLIKVVQSTLLGSILGNLLFVVGGCFIIASRGRLYFKFNANNASYSVSLLAIAALAMCVPTSLAVFDEWSTTEQRLKISRIVGILLGVMYVQWLFFQMSTHAHLFDQVGREENSGDELSHGSDSERDHSSRLHFGHASQIPQALAEGQTEEEPHLPTHVCCIVLFVATLCVAFHCDWLVESVLPVTEELGVSKAFVSTMLLPLVGNFSEVMAAFNIAAKDKLDLAMSIAIGAATQIALLVVPVTVIVGWCVDSPMDLDFEVLQIELLLFAIFIVFLSLRDGIATWLKGCMFITTYLIIAVCFWFLSDKEFDSGGIAPRSSVTTTSTFIM